MPRSDSPAVVALESAVMSEPLTDPVRVVAARLRAAGWKVSSSTVANIRGRAKGEKAKRGRRPGPYAASTAAGREALAVLVGIAEKRGSTVPDLLVWLAGDCAAAALVAVDRMREYDDAELPSEVTRTDLDAASKWLRDGGLRSRR